MCANQRCLFGAALRVRDTLSAYKPCAWHNIVEKDQLNANICSM